MQQNGCQLLNPGKVSVIIPAYNEADRIGATLDAIIHHKMADEIIVVDDGSTDNTSRVAAERGVKVVRQPKNRGKGAVMNLGLSAALGGIIVFLDADLGDTAHRAAPIIDAVKNGDADLAIVAFSTRGTGGFGFVKKFARWGIRSLCGYTSQAPLSGQRALRREVLEAIYPLRRDFGVETAMIIDAVRGGFKVVEIELALTHRPTGRTLRGFLHRAHQGFDISRAIGSRYLRYGFPFSLFRASRKSKSIPPRVSQQDEFSETEVS